MSRGTPRSPRGLGACAQPRSRWSFALLSDTYAPSGGYFPIDSATGEHGCASINTTRDEGTMRAILVHNYGGPDVLEITEMPTPQPGPGQLRIKVAAASINTVDVETRDATLAHAIPALPVGIGW